jgi:hypothetical protein
MALIEFNNEAGEGVVAFEPWRVTGPDASADRWYCHLTVGGARIFEFGCPCGTCGIVFSKIGEPAHRVDDAEAVELLGPLDAVPEEAVLRRLAKVLEGGVYYVTVIEERVRLVEPGSPEDYFATDVVRLFGLEPPDYKTPGDPGTPYYRIGPDHELPRSGRWGGPHKALLTAIGMPLHDPRQLDRDRLAEWKRQIREGRRPTVFAVSIIDGQTPAMAPPDPSYPYAEQLLFTNCLLDGHHRIQAAADLGVPVRILSLLSLNVSMVRGCWVTDADVETVFARFSRPPGS